MVIVIDSFEPLVVLRGAAAQRVMDEAGVARASGAASDRDPPRDFAEAMRRVEAEVWDAA